MESNRGNRGKIKTLVRLGGLVSKKRNQNTGVPKTAFGFFDGSLGKDRQADIKWKRREER